MLCYKCNREMTPVADTAWREHLDGERTRKTEFICVECRVYAELTISDYSKCGIEE